MFGVVYSLRNNNSEQEYFELMNAKEHQFSGKKCAPVYSSNTSISYTKSKGAFFEDDEYIVFFEGKILKREILIERIDINQKNITNAQLLLFAYKKYKKEFTGYIQGEFAIVIYNKKTQKLHSFRDPIGIIPFYYATIEGCFLFSTEFRRLETIKDLTKIDWTYVRLQFKPFNPDDTKENTWFTSIKRLPPGSYLDFKASVKITVKKYFKFEPKILKQEYSLAEIIKQFQDKIEESIHTQIKGEESIHSHFSGGLDCTGISAIAWKYAKQHNIPLYLYTCGLTDEQKKESYVAEDESSFVNDIAAYKQMPKPKMISSKETGSFEKSNISVLINDNLKSSLEETCRQIYKEKGDVLLSGFGGDECITYNEHPFFLARAFWNFKWKKLWLESKTYGFKPTIYNILKSKPFFSFFLTLLGVNIQITNRNRKQLLKEPSEEPELFKNVYGINEHIMALLDASNITFRIELEKELASYYDVEIRYPYFNIELLTFFLELPSKYKMLNGLGRRLYRDAIQKWIDYEPFVEQRKSRISSVPFAIFKASKAIHKNSINYKKILNQLHPDLKKIIAEDKFELPVNHKDLQSMIDHSWYIKLAEVDSIIKKYSKK